MAHSILPLVTELPVQWQSAVVDIESVAPLRQFNSTSYDVANMTAVACLQVAEARDYRLLLSCNVESGTRATARVMSSDAQFDVVKRFSQITKNEASDYIPLLDKSALMPSDSTETQKVDYIRKNFKHAVINIPAGQQKIRIHASMKLNPTNGNPREYELVQFAPLLGFTIAGGQTNLALTITFPPAFEGNNIAIDPAVVEQIAGQPIPTDAVPPFDGTIGAVRAFAWHWRNDPKVKIKYRYQ